MSIFEPIRKPFSNTYPSLSACLIVKDEARCLARCLDSLVGVVDEIIIVDTGSTDGTLEIARRYTDKIFQHPWNDDFSEARNFSLAQASGDYILIIDADEVLPAETARLIPAYLSRPDFQNRPLVLNWLVCSEQGDGLYSRGLFPNGYGIRFAGRVHEIPVLPGQSLSFYHCQELVVWHESSDPAHLSKQQYYQRLMYQALAEEGNPVLINHLQKHLGLNHLALAEWQPGWHVLSACYRGMRELGIEPRDGFYGDVLRGLVQAGAKLEHPDTWVYARELTNGSPQEPSAYAKKIRAKRWKSAIVSISMSLLAACQTVSSKTDAGVPSQPHTKPMLPNQGSPSQWGDFGIKAVYFCPHLNSTVIACYNSGGHPVVADNPDTGFPATSQDDNGNTCYLYDHCNYPCEVTNTCPLPDPTDPPNEEECVEEPGGPPCVILPGGGGGAAGGIPPDPRGYYKGPSHLIFVGPCSSGRGHRLDFIYDFDPSGPDLSFVIRPVATGISNPVIA